MHLIWYKALWDFHDSFPSFGPMGAKARYSAWWQFRYRFPKRYHCLMCSLPCRVLCLIGIRIALLSARRVCTDFFFSFLFHPFFFSFVLARLTVPRSPPESAPAWIGRFILAQDLGSFIWTLPENLLLNANLFVTANSKPWTVDPRGPIR